MSIRVEVREGEDLRIAFARFNNEVRRRYRRKWVKRRYGYFEKPCELRRKRKKQDQINRGRESTHLPLFSFNLRFRKQFLREGPSGFGK